MTLRHAFMPTQIGELLLVADHDAITGVDFADHVRSFDVESIGERADPADDTLLAQAVAELREYFAGTRRRFDVPVRARGDEFSERVWQRLQRIPYGETVTYGAIATELGDRNLAQRVGQVVGRNPVSIVIPCHRVMGADGSLTGFAGGLDRKRALLAIEEPEPASVGRLF